MTEISTEIRADATPYVSAPAEPMPAGLSYEAVLATLQSRLRDLNNQISTVRETIESRSQLANEIADEIQELKDLKTRMNEDGDKKVHVNDLSPEQRKMLKDAGIEFPDDMPTKEEFKDARWPAVGGHAEAREIRRAYKKGKISVEEIENAISSLNTRLQKVNSDNETLMIQLQEAISQRQVQIQLATNSMKAISSGEKQIVGNIGR